MERHSLICLVFVKNLSPFLTGNHSGSKTGSPIASIFPLDLYRPYSIPKVGNAGRDLKSATKSLATRHERKHQSAPTAILPARNQLDPHQAQLDQVSLRLINAQEKP